MGSKDVKAFYLSIDINVAAEEAKQEIEESDLEAEVETEELALFLTSTKAQEEIDR